jgi:fumarate reductase subunit C
MELKFKKEPTMPIWKAFAKNQFLVLVSSIFLLLASGYFVYGYLCKLVLIKITPQFSQFIILTEFMQEAMVLIVNIVTLLQELVKMQVFLL